MWRESSYNCMCFFKENQHLQNWLIWWESQHAARRLMEHLRKGPVSGERANMSWDGSYVGKGMKSGEGAYMYIWEEGQYVVRWLICKKRDNIWRMGFCLRRGPMSWDGLYAKRGTTSGEGACIQRRPICCEIAHMQKEGQHLKKGLIFKWKKRKPMNWFSHGCHG